ncbi:hypothetical protein SMSP2_02123 [Limihaloglobus sulfuriphilus]|uniref:Uncharacterized protein n=1 Tax=Limihaloglobus sulfuriphilus TaxID=1851148 RepID=A0A1Q2MGC0_9BACT|nr:hypothetical protein [Limihaloglobus sulfuriphilus]AQQ71745.1 hypothetical protein SMSP2_02123 [Limihaloglobus sulfuriphilus]
MRIKKLTIIILFSAMCINVKNINARTNYDFRGSISKDVLLNYLSRAITMNGLSYSACPEDDYRMIENIGAKFVGRVSYIWNSKTDYPAHYGKAVSEEDIFAKAEETARRLHEIDSDIIAQACIFEIVEKQHVNSVDIPERVFQEYGLEAVKRKFNYDDMLYAGGKRQDFWGPSQSVPDMSRLETRMWFFYRATRYIDLGYEAIHFGQCHLMDAADDGHKNWWDTITRIRKYAAENARRGLVLCDSHTHGIVDKDGNLMYDFHSYPSRPIDIAGKPYHARLEFGTHNSIYGKSKGGIAPSGWKCDSLPYIVEFDNTHTSGREGRPDLGSPWVWGYEEITWFTFRNTDFRNNWLEYAFNWIKENDPVGNLEMPGKVPTAFYHPGGRRLWYMANTPGEGCPGGYGQEQKIKDLWTKEQ